MENACYLEKRTSTNKFALQFGGHVRYIDLLYSLHSIISYNKVHKSDGKVIEHLLDGKAAQKILSLRCILEVNAPAAKQPFVLANMLNLPIERICFFLADFLDEFEFFEWYFTWPI